MSTYDIALAGNRRPQWPDRCVCCETPQPGHAAEISVTGSNSNSAGWTLDTALLAATGSTTQSSNTRVHVKVPCCRACAPALERRHFWKTIILYASALTGLAMCLGVIIWGTRIGIPSGMTGYLGGGLCVAMIVLPAIYELRNPPAFTFTPYNGKITYEFVSATFAGEFAEANEVPSPAAAADSAAETGLAGAAVTETVPPATAGRDAKTETSAACAAS